MKKEELFEFWEQKREHYIYLKKIREKAFNDYIKLISPVDEAWEDAKKAQLAYEAIK